MSDRDDDNLILRRTVYDFIRKSLHQHTPRSAIPKRRSPALNAPWRSIPHSRKRESIWDRLCCKPGPRNEPSRRVAEKLGMRDEGTAVRFLQIQGVYEDHVRYAMTAEEWRARGGETTAASV